ncbi:MAG: PEP-CTERM sorting domain-containing protein [Verrucomicrobiia bacterium]
MVVAEVSGVASPDDSTGNGEIIITAVPEPSALGLLAVGVPALLVRRRRKQ